MIIRPDQILHQIHSLGLPNVPWVSLMSSSRWSLWVPRIVVVMEIGRNGVDQCNPSRWSVRISIQYVSKDNDRMFGL